MFEITLYSNEVSTREKIYIVKILSNDVRNDTNHLTNDRRLRKKLLVSHRSPIRTYPRSFHLFDKISRRLTAFVPVSILHAFLFEIERKERKRKETKGKRKRGEKGEETRGGRHRSTGVGHGQCFIRALSVYNIAQLARASSLLRAL